MKLLLRCTSVAGFMMLCLPPIVDAAARADELGRIELYEYSGKCPLDAPPPDMHPVILQVPEEFRYASSKGAPRTWGVQILTYYPSLSSPKDPANKNYGLDCAGLCNGRILIEVEFRPRILETNSPNMGDFIARAQLKWKKTPPYPPNVSVRDLGPQDDFDEGFERTLTMPATARGDRSSPEATT
jgi:hypothetical protein